MIVSKSLTMRHLCLLLTITFANSRVLAQDPSSTSPLLSINRLFGAHEFETDPVPATYWSSRSSKYFTLEKAKEGNGRDLVRNDPATGKKEIFLPALAFVPKDAKEPLAVEAFEFSADESRLLIYTNSQRVWRRNTRGDYWILEVASGELKNWAGMPGPPP